MFYFIQLFRIFKNSVLMNYQTGPEGPGSNVDAVKEDPLKDKSVQELVKMLEDEGKVDDTDRPEIEALVSRFEGERNATIDLVQRELKESVKDMLENGYTLTDMNSYDTFKKVAKLAGVSVPVNMPQEVGEFGGVISLRLLNDGIHVYNTSTHKGIIDSKGNFIASLGDGDGRFDNNEISDISADISKEIYDKLQGIQIIQPSDTEIVELFGLGKTPHKSFLENGKKVTDEQLSENYDSIVAWNKDITQLNKDLKKFGSKNIQTLKDISGAMFGEELDKTLYDTLHRSRNLSATFIKNVVKILENANSKNAETVAMNESLGDISHKVEHTEDITEVSNNPLELAKSKQFLNNKYRSLQSRKDFQTFLNIFLAKSGHAGSFDAYGVDGKFGAETVAATKLFQKELQSTGLYGGKIDGMPGNGTMDALANYMQNKDTKFLAITQKVFPQLAVEGSSIYTNLA